MPSSIATLLQVIKPLATNDLVMPSGPALNRNLLRVCNGIISPKDLSKASSPGLVYPMSPDILNKSFGMGNRMQRKRGNPIAVPTNVVPKANDIMINPYSKGLTSQHVRTPSGIEQEIGNVVASRTVGMLHERANNRPNKKRRIDGYGTFESFSRMLSSPTPAFKEQFVQGNSRINPIDLAESPLVQVDDEVDELNFLSQRNNFGMDDITKPSDFHHSNELDAFRTARMRGDGQNQFFKKGIDDLRSQSEQRRDSEIQEIIDVDAQSTSLTGPRSPGDSLPPAGIVRSMTRKYEKLKNSRDVLNWIPDIPDIPAPTRQRKGKIAETMRQMNGKRSALNMEPVGQIKVSKYFDTSTVCKENQENFGEETADLKLEGHIEVEEWVDSEYGTTGKNSSLHWSSTQFILRSTDGKITKRFPFTDVLTAKISRVVPTECSFWAIGLPDVQMTFKFAANLKDSEKKYNELKNKIGHILSRKKTVNLRNRSKKTDNNTSKNVPIEILGIEATCALWEACQQDLTLQRSDDVVLVDPSTTQATPPNFPLKVSSHPESGPETESEPLVVHSEEPPEQRAKMLPSDRDVKTQPKGLTKSLAVTRRLRSSNALEQNVDLEQIILVYPPSGPGSINITNGLLKRLEPGEFLNDTLIEFGLKLWLHEMRSKDPVLAEKVHIFSSFFYKKLKGKGPQDGYPSVRKWTAKFDFFEKEYIIVPINENVHWYLAIIYRPGATLRKPLSPKFTTPRTRARKSEPSYSVKTRSVKSGDTNLNVGVNSLPVVQEASANSFYKPMKMRMQSSPAPTQQDIETLPESIQNVSLEDSNSSLNEPGSPLELLYPSHPLDDTVSATSSATTPQLDADGPMDDTTETTHIFTLDSMGSNHPQAQRILQQYLIDEAKDKKSLTAVRLATKRKVTVPSQPNFCDCGLYLLHFVRVFLQDPEMLYLRIREGQQVQWNADAIPALREILKKIILDLSEEWKATQARGIKRPAETVDEQGAASDREVEGILVTTPEKPPDDPESEDEPILVERTFSKDQGIVLKKKCRG